MVRWCWPPLALYVTDARVLSDEFCALEISPFHCCNPENIDRPPNALVQLQAHYHDCGEAASEKCLSAAMFVRRQRSGELSLRQSGQALASAASIVIFCSQFLVKHARRQIIYR
jgi:hypothetical protein